MMDYRPGSHSSYQKNLRVKVLMIVVAMLVIVVAVWIRPWNPAAEEIVMNTVTTQPAVQSKKPRSPRLKTEHEITNATADDWRDWMAGIEEDGESVSLSEVVGEGETVITKAWEGPDGRYYFTLITPRSGRGGEAGTGIQLTATEMAVSLDGAEDRLAAPTVLVEPGQSATVEIRSPEGFRYRLAMTAEFLPDESSFLLDATVTRAMPADL